jgi:RNA polymerase primary sigma factor
VVAEPVQKAAEVAVDEDDIDLEDINMEDFEDNENADDVEIPDAPKEEIKVQSVLDLVPEQREVAAVEENVEIADEAPKATEIEAVAS